MRVGDLVKYVHPSIDWNEIGIIVGEIPGTDERKIVHWSTGTDGSYRANELEVLSCRES